MIQSPTVLKAFTTSGSKSFVFRVSPASVMKLEVPQTSLSSRRCGSSCFSLKELIRIGSFFPDFTDAILMTLMTLMKVIV